MQTDELDRRLILALAPDARRSFGSLARELGADKRTLERRYRRLADERVVRMFPSGGSQVANMSLVNVQFTLDPQAGRAALLQKMLELFPDHMVHDLEARRPWLWAYARNAKMLESAAAVARGFPGVQQVRLLHSRGMQLSPHYPDWLARVLANDAGSRPTPDRSMTRDLLPRGPLE